MRRSSQPRSHDSVMFVGPAIFYLIPGLVAGVGLLRGQHWARIVLVLFSLFVLVGFPTGTVLGGFGLWVLLGPDSRRTADSGVDRPPDPVRAATAASKEHQRVRGILVAMAAVGSAFVIVIGTGFRVTSDPANPIGDALYYGAIVVTCVHLQPIERAMRDAGIAARLDDGSHVRAQHVRANCQVDPDAVRERFSTPALVEYSTPTPTGRAFEHLLPAMLTCGQCGSIIRVVHRIDGKPETDDLQYRIFRDVAFSMSARLASPLHEPGEDQRREMFKQQLILLRRLKPEWEARCHVEHLEVLATHPFVDPTYSFRAKPRNGHADQ